MNTEQHQDQSQRRQTSQRGLKGARGALGAPVCRRQASWPALRVNVQCQGSHGARDHVTPATTPEQPAQAVMRWIPCNNTNGRKKHGANDALHMRMWCTPAVPYHVVHTLCYGICACMHARLFLEVLERWDAHACSACSAGRRAEQCRKHEASTFPCMHMMRISCSAKCHAHAPHGMSHVNPCSVVLRAPMNACSAHLSVEAPLACNVFQELAAHGALTCTCSPTLARHAAATRCCRAQPDHGRPVWKAFKRV